MANNIHFVLEEELVNILLDRANFPQNRNAAQIVRIKQLLREGAHPNGIHLHSNEWWDDPVCNAAKNGDLKVLRILLRYPSASCRRHNALALKASIVYGRISAAQIIMDKRPDCVNKMDDGTNIVGTPLCLAIMHNTPDDFIKEMIHKYGANVNQTMYGRHLPLEACRSRGRYELAAYLIRRCGARKDLMARHWPEQFKALWMEIEHMMVSRPASVVSN
jgi:hypothetical protein